MCALIVNHLLSCSKEQLLASFLDQILDYLELPVFSSQMEARVPILQATIMTIHEIHSSDRNDRNCQIRGSSFWLEE
jgi:hypothetical protein